MAQNSGFCSSLYHSPTEGEKISSYASGNTLHVQPFPISFYNHVQPFILITKYQQNMGMEEENCLLIYVMTKDYFGI